MDAAAATRARTAPAPADQRPGERGERDGAAPRGAGDDEQDTPASDAPPDDADDVGRDERVARDVLEDRAGEPERGARQQRR